MIKMRLYGTMDEIINLAKKLDYDPNYKVLTFSRPYRDRGQTKYHRIYIELEKGTKMISNIYIASSSKFIEECEHLADLLLQEFEFYITRRWWDHYIKDTPDFQDYSDQEFYAHPQVQMIRELDFNAIDNADLVIIIVKDQYKLTGALVECGYALAKGKLVIFLGQAKKSAMISGCIHVKDIDQLFQLLRKIN